MKQIDTFEDIANEQGFKLARKRPIHIRVVELTERIQINTREGSLIGEPGDFLAEGINGEIYPIGREIFFKTYDFI